MFEHGFAGLDNMIKKYCPEYPMTDYWIKNGGISILYRSEYISNNGLDHEVIVKIYKDYIIKELGFAKLPIHKIDLTKLRHPNLMKIHNAIRDEYDECYVAFVCEDCGDQNLEESIHKERNITNIKQDLEVFCSIIEAVNYLHKSKISHNDIKPGNISVKPAKLLDPDLISSNKEEFNSNSNFFTFCYCAPELISKSKVNEKSDIFSLGAVFYAIFEGRSPPEAIYCDFVEWIKACQGKKDFDFPFTNPILNDYKEIREFIKNMLSFDPEKRPDFNEISNKIPLWSLNFNCLY